MMVAVVSLGSQVHHVFQIGRAQIEPVTILMKINTIPISTAATPTKSQIFVFLTRYKIPAIAANKKESMPTHPAATWK